MHPFSEKDPLPLYGEAMNEQNNTTRANRRRSHYWRRLGNIRASNSVQQGDSETESKYIQIARILKLGNCEVIHVSKTTTTYYLSYTSICVILADIFVNDIYRRSHSQQKRCRRQTLTKT